MKLAATQAFVLISIVLTLQFATSKTNGNSSFIYSKNDNNNNNNYNNNFNDDNPGRIKLTLLSTNDIVRSNHGDLIRDHQLDRDQQLSSAYKPRDLEEKSDDRSSQSTEYLGNLQSFGHGSIQSDRLIPEPTTYNNLESKYAKYQQNSKIVPTSSKRMPMVESSEKRGLNPIILIPGDGGSRIQAKLDRQKAAHVYCERKSNDWFDLWLNLSLLVPFALDCWVEK